MRRTQGFPLDTRKANLGASLMSLTEISNLQFFVPIAIQSGFQLSIESNFAIALVLHYYVL